MYSRPETMQSALDYLDLEYGGVEGYLKASGVTQADIAQVRRYLVAVHNLAYDISLQYPQTIF
jgi:Tyrosine phosphatase family